MVTCPYTSNFMDSYLQRDLLKIDAQFYNSKHAVLILVVAEKTHLFGKSGSSLFMASVASLSTSEKDGVRSRTTRRR